MLLGSNGVRLHGPVVVEQVLPDDGLLWRDNAVPRPGVPARSGIPRVDVCDLCLQIRHTAARCATLIRGSRFARAIVSQSLVRNAKRNKCSRFAALLLFLR